MEKQDTCSSEDHVLRTNQEGTGDNTELLCAPQSLVMLLHPYLLTLPTLLTSPYLCNPSWELLQQKGSQELSWHMHTAQNRSAGATTLKLWFLCLWIFKAATWVCAHSFSAYVSWARSSHAVVSSHEQPVSCIKALCKEGSSPSPERTWGTSAWAPSIAQTASWLHLQSSTVKPKYRSCYSHPRTVGKSGLGLYLFQLRDMAQPWAKGGCCCCSYSWNTDPFLWLWHPCKPTLETPIPGF